MGAALPDPDRVFLDASAGDSVGDSGPPDLWTQSVQVTVSWEVTHSQAHGKQSHFHFAQGPLQVIEPICCWSLHLNGTPTGHLGGLRLLRPKKKKKKKKKEEKTSPDPGSYLALFVFLSICCPRTSSHSIPSLTNA